jgi:hypothetical protein
MPGKAWGIRGRKVKAGQGWGQVNSKEGHAIITQPVRSMGLHKLKTYARGIWSFPRAILIVTY